MSTLTFGQGDGRAAARVMRRRALALRQVSQIAPVASTSISMWQPTRVDFARPDWRVVSGVALLAIALHAAIAWRVTHTPLAHAQPAVLRPVEVILQVTPPKPLPETVTPPKPLPQKPLPQKAAPPARPRAAPVRPTVAPRPAPAPSTPVVAQPAQNAPAPNAVAVAPTTPAPVVAPASPEPVTEPSGDADYLHNPAPVYPPVAQDQGWEGHVVLRVHVLASGRPDSVSVAVSSGRKMLDEAALKAVSNWSFVPARRGATATDGWVKVPIDFRLG